MSYPHFFRPAAVLEYRRALDYYSLNAPHKVDELTDAATATIDLLTETPKRMRVRELDIRCAFVAGFPYQVWYVWHDVERVVEVVAFLHARQSRNVLHERHRP